MVFIETAKMVHIGEGREDAQGREDAGEKSGG
jgi:hypothetical protein